MKTYYCLPTLVNVSTQSYTEVLRIIISECSGSDYCKNYTEIHNFYDTIVKTYTYFPIQLGILMPYAEASDKDPLKYMIDFKTLASSATQGLICQVNLDQFKIVTDKSVLPVLESLS